ncbi:MAG: hypothetical protein C0500_10090 [Sphingobium sp.]|nr:hypothetical protein [Sphingobium sp.]
MKLRLLIIVFLIASGLLGLSGLATLFAWTMADFDCADGYWECRKTMVGPLAMHLGLPLAAWLVLAGLLVREWKKA